MALPKQVQKQLKEVEELEKALQPQSDSKTDEKTVLNNINVFKRYYT